MNSRSLVWVGLFGGMSLVLLAWLFTSSSDDTASTRKTAPVAQAELGDAKTEAKENLPSYGDEVRANRVRLQPLGTKFVRARDIADRVAIRAPMMTRPAPVPEEVAAADLGPFAASQAGVQEAVDAAKGDLESCFETARFHAPELPGAMELTVDFDKLDDGSVAVGSVRSSATDVADAKIFEGCATTVLGDIAFDGQASGPVHVAVQLGAE